MTFISVVLPGAVRADEPDDLAGAHVDVGLVEGDHAAEVHAHALTCERRTRRSRRVCVGVAAWLSARSSGRSLGRRRGRLRHGAASARSLPAGLDGAGDPVRELHDDDDHARAGEEQAEAEVLAEVAEQPHARGPRKNVRP